MNRSLCSEDFELVLDNQHVSIPATVKETLLNSDVDTPLDFATYSGDYCWAVLRQDAFVWNFKNQQESIAQNKKRCAHLRLPASGLGYTTQLVKVFEKAKGHKGASALSMSREGSARFWPNFMKETFVDSVLHINHEVVMNLHLIDCGSNNSSTVFILVTTYGSIYSVRISPEGNCTSDLLGTRENQGVAGKLSSFFFGTSATSDSDQILTSMLYWREGEEVEDIDEETTDPIILTIGPNSLAAFDVSNKSLLWSVETKPYLGKPITKYLEKQTKHKIPDLQVTALDAQEFRDGVLLLSSASYSDGEYHKHFLTYLTVLDYKIPQITYLHEVSNAKSAAELYELLLDDSYMNQVKLVIPMETAQARSSYKTDGIFILHPNYVQSIYLPDDLSEQEELPVNKTCSLSSGQQLIGYGVDSQFCYVMTANSKTATLRLLPKGFEHSALDDINIEDVISYLPRPQDNPEGEDLYVAFMEFCEKNLNKASSLANSLIKLRPDELLQLTHDFAWNFFNEIVDHADVDVELREKKKFLDYFILFLKHNELLNEVFTSIIPNPRVNLQMFGTDLFAELYERIQILMNLYKWKMGNVEHADILRHVGIQLAKDLRLRNENGQTLAIKFSLLHLLPQSGVNLCRSLLEVAGFNEVSQRYDMICYSVDLLLDIAQTIRALRQGKGNLPPSPEGGVKWTRFLAKSYSDMAMILATEIGQEYYNNNEKMKFAQYIARLLSFHFAEKGKTPDGHEVIRHLRSIGEERLALELADRFKDFNMICRLCLEKSDEEAIEHFKRRYADDNFEGYYLEYLNRKELYSELLEQTGEQADKFISTLDHIRWRRELQRDEFSKAGKTLLLEAEKPEYTLQRQKVLSSIAKLSYSCTDDIEDHIEELDDIDLQQHLIEYQESVPRDFLRRIYPDNQDRLLSPAELVELCKLRMEEPELPSGEFFRSLTLVVRLLKYKANKGEYIDARQLIWEAAIRADDWSRVEEHHFKYTTFARVFEDVLEEDEEWISLALPDTELLLKNTAQDRKKCPTSNKYIRYCIEQTKAELEQ